HPFIPMHRPLLALLLLCSTAYAIRGRPRCYVDQSVSWATGKESELRAVNLTKCGYGTHSFEIGRPVNSSKAIRARIISLDEDSETTFTISVAESTVGQDGKEVAMKRKDLIGVDDSVLSSPYTTLRVFVTKRGPPSKAEIIFEFTLEDIGCPYPFLESHIGTPLIISSDVLTYECDFSVTALDPGAALELTSINESLPHRRHSVAVVVYDGFTLARLHRVEQADFDRDLKEHLGTSKITIHVTNPMGGRGEDNDDVAFITINSILDDCTCPESNIVLNHTDMGYVFGR
ncbi:hypothetical protein PRIPAC_72455, partial [Pristionchus pacificus]